MRDVQLDIYRALAMVYIVCFIHVMYWLGFGGEPLRSIALVEMPVIFFISGASLSLSGKERGLVQTLCNRARRVLIPYYIYALVMVLAVVLLSLVSHRCDITSYGLKDVAKILLCQDIPQAPYVWHLWFIVPYMLLTCTFQWQRRVLTKVNRGGYFVLTVLLFVGVQWLSDYALLRNVCCYNVFMVAGYCFYRRMKVQHVVAVAIVSVLALLVGTEVFDVSFTPMQGHKFPPDWFYVTWGMLALCLLSLLVWKVRLPDCRLLQLWNTRGYTIYLYQNVVCAVVYALLSKTDERNILVFAACMVAMLTLSTLLSFITYPLETWIMNRIRK